MIRPRSLVATLLLAASAAGAAVQPATVDLRAEQQPLYVLIERLAKQCDAGLVIDHALQQRLGGEITLVAKDATWADAVKLLASEFRLTVTLDGDRLVVTDADVEARKRLVTRTYDARTLTFAQTSHPGPALEIPQPGGTASRLLPPIEPERKPEVNELVELIRRQIASASWASPLVSIADYDGSLVVTQTPEVQQQIADLLTRLERTLSRQVVVRCYRLAKPPADGGTSIDPAAWKALSATLTPNAAFTVLDETQNHHFSGVQRAYTADLDVVQGVYDPIVTVISQGLVVDATPTVTTQGVVLAMRLDATIDQQTARSPVTDAAGLVRGTLELPDATTDHARDIRLVPDGGAAVYTFGDRAYAVSCQVVAPAK